MADHTKPPAWLVDASWVIVNAIDIEPAYRRLFPDQYALRVAQQLHLAGYLHPAPPIADVEPAAPVEQPEAMS